MEKRTADGLGFSRRSSTLSYSYPKHKNGTIQCCNRIGCSTRFYVMEGSRMGDQEKAKYPKASFRAMSTKTISGNTSKALSTSSDFRKPCLERRKRTSLQEMTTVEDSNRKRGIDDSESNNIKEGRVEDLESAILNGFSELITGTLETCHTKSSSRKQTSQHWEYGFQDTSPSSSGHSLASKNTRQTNKQKSQMAHKYGPRNDSCRSISAFLPAGCSSSHSGSTRRIEMVRKGTSSGEMVRKRPSSGETSTIRGKAVASLRGGYSVSRHRGHSAPSPSHPECSVPQQTSSRYRKPSTSRNGTGSVRTPLASSTETSHSEQDGSSFSLSVPIMTSELPRMEFSTNASLPGSSSRSFTIGLSSTSHKTPRRPCSSSQNAHIRPVSHAEDGNTALHGALGNRDGYRHFTTEGVAEVLLALERIEQTEDLTYEELLVLESNLSLGGLAFYDQHRDMRLDIDNMSYEELLALTEKMGTVSTALPEEALSRCLNISIYESSSLYPEATGHKDGDTKCSVCQEEYVVGDEVGKLACKHRYHVACIYQWLRQKNWCPICKASACTS